MKRRNSLTSHYDTSSTKKRRSWTTDQVFQIHFSIRGLAFLNQCICSSFDLRYISSFCAFVLLFFLINCCVLLLFSLSVSCSISFSSSIPKIIKMTFLILAYILCLNSYAFFAAYSVIIVSSSPTPNLASSSVISLFFGHQVLLTRHLIFFALLGCASCPILLWDAIPVLRWHVTAVRSISTCPRHDAWSKYCISVLRKYLSE